MLIAMIDGAGKVEIDRLDTDLPALLVRCFHPVRRRGRPWSSRPWQVSFYKAGRSVGGRRPLPQKGLISAIDSSLVRFRAWSTSPCPSVSAWSGVGG